MECRACWGEHTSNGNVTRFNVAWTGTLRDPNHGVLLAE